MKLHLVLKLHQPVPDGLAIPDWLTFLHDKTSARTQLEPSVDRVLADSGVTVWVTREYLPAGRSWSTAEIDHGLDRTYRLIVRHPGSLPPTLLPRLSSLSTVEQARQLEVAEAALPAPVVSVQATGPMPSRRRPSELIHAAYAKALTRGHPDVKIAVLDTGVNLHHPELHNKVAAAADFVDLTGLDTTAFIGDMTAYDNDPVDEVGHGSHVSGILAAQGVAMDEGVAPDCPIIAVRVLATMRDGDRICGAGIVDNINAGLKWAVDNGADVLNMSLGIRHTEGGLPHEDVIRYALGKNVTVVAASGNDGSSARYYPGALPGVVAVGAADSTGSIAAFTSFGARITVLAPGVDIYSSYAHSSYVTASGTSQASPFVAGGIALMKAFARERGQRLTNADVFSVLRNTSDRVDGRPRHHQAGYGLINLADAFKFLAYSLN